MKNVLAAYTHLHGMAVPEWAENFVKSAEQQRGWSERVLRHASSRMISH